MYQKSLLPNELSIITSTMPYTRSVCVSVFIATGSRYEKEEEAGVSHFLEHLCFKGTQQRSTAKEISEAIEGVGGVLNGGTDKELTAYWCKVARPHFSLALDVVADMLRYSKFDPQDIERERQIITEEINMSRDFPQHRVNLLIDELVWLHQPLGRDVAGNKESVVSLSRQNIVDYFAHQYLPNNAVVSIAGDISHEEVVASISKVFSDWTKGMPQPWYPTQDDQTTPRVLVEPRDTEQAHLCLALLGLSAKHPDRFIVDLLSALLGEGMSSRLFINLREKQGLAYDIHSYVSHFLDSGSVTIYAGVDPKRIELAMEAILKELRQLREEVPESELHKVKELLKGRLLLRMEDTRNVASWLGGQESLLGNILSVDEVLSIIDAIKPGDLQRVAQELLLTEKLSLAIVGPVQEKDFEDLLQF